MELKDYRKEIDEMDSQITALLNRRMECCRKIGAYKKANGLPVYDGSREEQKLTEVSSLSAEENAEGIRDIYSKIMEICRRIQ